MHPGAAAPAAAGTSLAAGHALEVREESPAQPATTDTSGPSWVPSLPPQHALASYPAVAGGGTTASAAAATAAGGALRMTAADGSFLAAGPRLSMASLPHATTASSAHSPLAGAPTPSYAPSSQPAQAGTTHPPDPDPESTSHAHLTPFASEPNPASSPIDPPHPSSAAAADDTPSPDPAPLRPRVSVPAAGARPSRPRVPESKRGILPRRGLHNLMRAAGLAGDHELHPDVERALIAFAEDMIAEAVAGASSLARMRRPNQAASSRLQARDVAVWLQRVYRMRVPGYGGVVQPYRRPAASEVHGSRASAVRKENAKLAGSAGGEGGGEGRNAGPEVDR